MAHPESILDVLKCLESRRSVALAECLVGDDAFASLEIVSRRHQARGDHHIKSPKLAVVVEVPYRDLFDLKGSVNPGGCSYPV
eukprot:8075133-Pyramimonas_sp.AAC.1